jgi:hypothetical protein
MAIVLWPNSVLHLLVDIAIYCDVLPKSLKAGISEAALFTRQRTRRTATTQRTSAMQLVGSFSAATELLGKVLSIPAAKTLLKSQTQTEIVYFYMYW